MPDNLTPEQRSYCMSRIKGKNTGIELKLRSALHKKGFRFRLHAKELPGKPDIVFRKAHLAIFIDGDFWHGYRFDFWKGNLSDSWKEKISNNIDRDAQNNQKLNKMGWTVLRIWQHEINNDIVKCIDNIAAMISTKTQSQEDGGA